MDQWIRGSGDQGQSRLRTRGEVRVPLPRGGNLSIRSTRDIRGTARLIQPEGEEYVRCWVQRRRGDQDRRGDHFVVEGQTMVVALE